MFRYLFKDEKGLTTIHKEYCNHGKENGIKACLNILGANYNCNTLISTFGECVNDSTDPNKYY